MVSFKGKKYQLFFSNNLQLLRALNYADELFFNEFEKLAGKRYRILSIIRKGWQQKYGLEEDIEELGRVFLNKLSDSSWIKEIVSDYENRKDILSKKLSRLEKTEFSKLENKKLADELMLIRKQVAPLDAMSNMLHLFSTIVGDDFITRLQRYSSDSDLINKNFVFYTQPLKESKYAKILVKELKDEFSLNSEDRNLSEIIRAGAYIKDDVSALLEERGTKMQKLFDEIGKRLNIPPEKIYFLSVEEITNALTGKVPVSSKLMGDRERLTVIFYPERTININEGTSAEKFLSDGAFEEERVVAKNTEFTGQIASLGKATGRAVVVSNSNEANTQVEKGDILVAPYTAPEYVPAMKKAGAIITETGGITSHAAIVSRELGIPCVIGVKDITKLLKTGDKISVDASKGLITKLS